MVESVFFQDVSKEIMGACEVTDRVVCMFLDGTDDVIYNDNSINVFGLFSGQV